MKLYIPDDPESFAIVAEWIGERVKDFDPARCDAVMASVTDDGRILGAVAYQRYRETDIEMVCAGEPGWLNRTAIKAYFAYPFIQLGCKRVTVICHRKNKRARKFVERLGFRLEGVHRKAMDNGDAISYGLLRSETKWLNYGQEKS